MTIAEFLTNFGEVANAPGGVARLRELILQLAFAGDLTISSPVGSPASLVFQQCQQTKADWIATGKIRQQLTQHVLSVDECPWKLPENWLWCRLGEVTTYGTTDKAEFSDVTPNTWVLELEDIEKDTSRLLAKVRAKDRRFQSSKNRFSNGDVLYGKLRPYLDKVVLADEDGVCTTEIIPITIYCGILPQYVRWYLKSPFFRTYANGSTHGMNLPRMGTEAGRNAVFPLAPLAEQERIVAKVDELMALCDQLEAQQRERQRRFPVLSRTCHARFAEAPTPENLNRIFDETGTVSPDDLRKTIINFAVQGFLVNQEPTDEPAFDAWARIQKVRLAAGEKDFGYLHEDEAPFAIPKGWCWIKMGNLALSSDSGWSPQCESTPRNGTNWGVLKVSAVSWDDFNPDENKAFPAGMSPRPECEVHNGDFLLSRANTEELVARSVVVTTTPPHLMMSDKIVRFNFPEELEKRYINFANSATFARSHYAKHASGTSSSMKNVGRGTMCNLAIPFPPLAEQKRIVSKVDELMALVDQLEAQQQERDKLAEAFAKACVASFTGTTQLERPEKMKAPNF